MSEYDAHCLVKLTVCVVLVCFLVIIINNMSNLTFRAIAQNGDYV